MSNDIFSGLNTYLSFSYFRWAFKMYDKDGSGSIELPEMIEIIGTLYEMEGVPKVRNRVQDKLIGQNPSLLVSGFSR